MKSANIQEKIVNNVIMGKDSKGNVALPEQRAKWKIARGVAIYSCKVWGNGKSKQREILGAELCRVISIGKENRGLFLEIS